MPFAPFALPQVRSAPSLTAAEAAALEQVISPRSPHVLPMISTRYSHNLPTISLEQTISKLPNKNRPSDYRWLEATLSLIALNTAPVVRARPGPALPIATDCFVLPPIASGRDCGCATNRRAPSDCF